MNSGETWSETTYAEVESRLGYTFRNRNLLLTAFTSKTYANNCGGECNERLEWLGDAILDFFASDMLYAEHPSANEGKLTELRKQYVSEEALTPITEKLGLMDFLRYSGGKSNFGRKDPSDLFEAVVAAIYLDGGIEAARAFAETHVAFTEIIDYKSLLQEYVLDCVKTLPSYTDSVQNQDGEFECIVSALGRSAEGKGINSQAAEKDAAKKLYEILTQS